MKRDVEARVKEHQLGARRFYEGAQWPTFKKFGGQSLRLSRGAGKTVWPMPSKGVSGSARLTGNEESLTTYHDEIVIDQNRLKYPRGHPWLKEGSFSERWSKEPPSGIVEIKKEEPKRELTIDDVRKIWSRCLYEEASKPNIRVFMDLETKPLEDYTIRNASMWFDEALQERPDFEASTKDGDWYDKRVLLI